MEGVRLRQAWRVRLYAFVMVRFFMGLCVEVWKCGKGGEGEIIGRGRMGDLTDVNLGLTLLSGSGNTRVELKMRRVGAIRDFWAVLATGLVGWEPGRGNDN